MARKTKELSLEEKLEQALVPAEIVPYEIPSNWCWTHCGDILNLIGGGTPNKAKSEYWNGDINWASVKDIKGDYLCETIDFISDEGFQNSSASMCEIEDLILVTRIEPGKTIISKIETSINQDLKIVKSKLSSNFLQFYFRNFQYLFEEKSSGSTVKGITVPNVYNTVFPLPPSGEQKRIVDAIESMFAKLDEAKEIAELVADSSNTRKYAILHDAFEGKLTAVWRKNNAVSMDAWRESTIGKELVCIKDKYNPEFHEVPDIPYIGLEHIEKGNGIIGQGASEDVKSIKSLFKSGDILYGKLRPYLDKHDISDFDGMCSTDILVYRAKNYNEARFYNYLLGTTEFMDYAQANSSGINLPRTSEKAVSAFKVKIPLEEEMTEIVNVLDSILKKDKIASESADAVIESIDMMKKSILAKAFRGELGTNNEAETSSIEILKEILGMEV